MSVQLKKVLIPVAALVILLLMVVWLAGGFANKISPSVIEKLPITAPNYFTVEHVKVPMFEPISAAITAKEATVISSRTIARIDTINVRAGESVSKGQLLIALEQKDVEAQVSQAKQQVKSLSVRLNEAAKNLKRTINLRTQKLVSEFLVDKEQATVDALTADLISAKQALKHAETVLSYNALTSPIDGVVIDRFAEPGDTAQPGKTLLSLYNPNSLRVSAQVREHLAVKLRVGQHVEVDIPSKDLAVSATIDEIIPAANTGSRSFLVNVSIPAENALLPGMYAKLRLPTGEKNALIIPANKVVSVGQLNMVWIIENGEKQRRLVRVATEPQVNSMVEIISGLAVGDKVVSPVL